MCPWGIDEVDDRAVGWIGGGGEDADGLMKQEVARGAGLEDFAFGGEVIEFSEREAAIADDVAVEHDLALFKQLLGMAFAEAVALGDELGEGHGVGNF